MCTAPIGQINSLGLRRLRLALCFRFLNAIVEGRIEGGGCAVISKNRNNGATGMRKVKREQSGRVRPMGQINLQKGFIEVSFVLRRNIVFSSHRNRFPPSKTCITSTPHTRQFLHTPHRTLLLQTRHRQSRIVLAALSWWAGFGVLLWAELFRYRWILHV